MASYNAPNVVGDILSMNYTGTVDTVTIQIDGIYRLKVWGASGGGSSSYGGRGGYATGEIELKKGQVIYVCIGQSGVVYYEGNNRVTYNGGGGTSYGGYSGGGATHMAFVGGTLANIGYSTFVDAKKGIIVAGGGGAAYGIVSGGSGGGTSGANGSGSNYGSGGTQTTPGVNQTYRNLIGSFGLGATSGNAGGGAGLYGGGGGHETGSGGGGGGSGYISPMLTDASMSNGLTDYNTHGSALIELVSKSIPPVYIDGTKITEIIFNGVVLGS